MHYRAFNDGVTGWGKVVIVTTNVSHITYQYTLLLLLQWTADDHVALLQQMPYAVGTGSVIIRSNSQVIVVTTIVV